MTRTCVTKHDQAEGKARQDKKRKTTQDQKTKAKTKMERQKDNDSTTERGRYKDTKR